VTGVQTCALPILDGTMPIADLVDKIIEAL
jgi:hypothetical protein